jgi:hypothetical protein
MVLGCSNTLPESPARMEAEDEKDALIEALKVFTSRDDWDGKILAIWKKLDDERWKDVQQSVDI